MDLEMENDKGGLEAKETTPSCTTEPINTDPPVPECIEAINVDPSLHEIIEPIKVKDPPEYEHVYKRAPVSLHQIFQELSRDSDTFDAEAADVLMEMADDFVQAVLEKTFRLVDNKSTKVLRCSDLMMILRSYCDIDLNHFAGTISSLGRYSYDKHLSTMPREKTEKRPHSLEQLDCASNKLTKKDSLNEFKSVSVGHTKNRKRNLFSVSDSIQTKKPESTKKKLHKITGKKVNVKQGSVPSKRDKSADLISSSSSVSNFEKKRKCIDSVSSKSRTSSETYLKPVSEYETILKIDDEKNFLKPTIVPSLSSKHMRNLSMSSFSPHSQEKCFSKKSASAKHVHKKSASHVSNSSSHKISSKHETSLPVSKCKDKERVSSDSKNMRRKTNTKLKRKSHKSSVLKKQCATHSKTSENDLKKKKSTYVASKSKLAYDSPKQKENSRAGSQKSSINYQFNTVRSLLSKESGNIVSKEEETAAIISKLNYITEFYANKSSVENRRVTGHPVCSMSLPCKKLFPPKQNTSVVGYVDYIKKAFEKNTSNFCQCVSDISDIRENSVEDFMSGESQDLYTLIDPKADNICSYAVYRKRKLHLKNHFMRFKSSEKVKTLKSGKTVKLPELIQSKQITRPRCTNAQMTKNVICNIPKEFMPFLNRSEKWMVLASSGKHKPEAIISSKAVKKCISKIPSCDFVKKKIAAPALYRRSALALMCRNVSAAASYQQAANALLYKELDVANYYKTHADKLLYETTMDVVGKGSCVSSNKICPNMYNKIATPALKKLLPVVANYVALKQGKRFSSSSAASASPKPVSRDHSNEAFSVPVSSPHESKRAVIVSRETEEISKMKVALLEDFYLNQALTLYEEGKKNKKMKKCISQQIIQSELNDNVTVSAKQASETMLGNETPYEQNVPSYENQNMDDECVVGPSSVTENNESNQTILNTKCRPRKEALDDYVSFALLSAERKTSVNSFTDTVGLFHTSPFCPQQLSTASSATICQANILPTETNVSRQKNLNLIQEVTNDVTALQNVSENASGSAVFWEKNSRYNFSSGKKTDGSEKKRKRKKSSLSAEERDSYHSEKRKKRKKGSVSFVQEKRSQSLKHLRKKSASSSSACIPHSSNSFIPSSQSQEPIMVTVPFRFLPDCKREELSAKLHIAKRS
ncbi:uncharacterized protein LOC118199701 [Stegodyphus dumicola]|uniref:uncharacterized protein LOC118199701 n=1 Tax=Stegodyphus dumicola TaxID=202533 RepID=UPI0015B21CB7|nr:uncharacterized protein LOC118199701 [Stegodyphus dumicola]XP_035227502.1 uncharacterized protein LOC118199701 [Stegodyphus dumicola]XP_035227503.1 uncharacterized protein LOC118199701 [Stegodyphus dumicola]XP_035227504.1 uncharacterized protein LOC118199701 [Stegodyphus dumicola]